MKELKPRIHENGIDYILVGDYYVPDWKLPEEHRPIGRWGNLHRAYLRQFCPALYSTLVLSGELHTYLADLNEQATERCSLIIEQMAEAEGVDEAIPPSQGSWVSRSTPWQSMLPRWRSMGSSEQSARRSSPGPVSSATAVSGTPSCRLRMPSPSVTSARWRRRGKPWNGSGHRQEPKSWALRSLRQQGSGVRKVPPCTPL